jgi:hypothetical protein
MLPGTTRQIDNLKLLDVDLSSIYRTQSLMQAYNLLKADQFVAITGHQNISFSYRSPILQQRIDRIFTPAGS